MNVLSLSWWLLVVFWSIYYSFREETIIVEGWVLSSSCRSTGIWTRSSLRYDNIVHDWKKTTRLYSQHNNNNTNTHQEIIESNDINSISFLAWTLTTSDDNDDDHRENVYSLFDNKNVEKEELSGNVDSLFDWKQIELSTAKKEEEDDDDENTRDEDDSLLINPIIQTYNWCRYFVYELELCPWTRTSLQTTNAIQFFIIPYTSLHSRNLRVSLLHNNLDLIDDDDDNDGDDDDTDTVMRQNARRIIRNVAYRFQKDILTSIGSSTAISPSNLERAAVYMVIFLPPPPSLSSSSSEPKRIDDDNRDTLNNAETSNNQFPYNFYDFYDWFLDLEDQWYDDEDINNVIIAPFHPDWQFFQMEVDDSNINANNNSDTLSLNNTSYKISKALNYEKKSPFPLVSLVSARVVEQAGEITTQNIGQHNQQILLDKVHRDTDKNNPTTTNNNNYDIDVWKEFWESAINKNI